MTTRPPLAACFAGGGGYGVGYNMGIVDGLRQGGIDLTGAPTNGTSAGSITAAALATGLTFDELVDIWARNAESTTRLFWNSGGTLAADLFPPRPDATTFDAMAVRLARWRREALSSAEHPMADIVAASCSVMPVIRPHRVDGKWYVDGGHISNGSVDFAPASDLLLVITPFRERGMGFAGWALTRRNKREIRTWVERHGGEVLTIEPTPEIANRFSAKFSDIANIEVGRRVYEPSVEYGRNIAAEIRRIYPAVVDRIAA